MGEVYKARDTRLDRAVAIKVLPAEAAADPERRARFEREARAIAALSHPRICTVHDVGRHEAIDYLVMEYLDGETLADRLAKTKGALPIEDVLTIGISIADALDKAHHAGIVHRDLKPANVMLTRSGPKLLDFGLAKLRGPAAPISLSGVTRLTTAVPNTAHGTILGTIHYMAPEQVEGREADARSDIWALGAVLYEITTGRKPFDGESAASVIGGILKDTPAPVSVRQPVAPNALDHLVERCLAKDPDERWQDAGDVKRELDWIARTLTASRPGTVVSQEPVGSRVAFVAASVAIGALAVSVLLWWSPWRQVVAPAPVSATTVRINISLGVPAASTSVGPDAVLSPDGRQIVIVAEGTMGSSRLLTRRVDQSQPVDLRGTDGAYAPFFSPDGQWVAFFAGGRLKKTQIDGSSEPVNVCDAPAGRGGTWSADGYIIAALDSQAGLSRIPAGGGPVTPLTTLAPGENSHRWPQALPGGRSVIFSANTTFGNFDEASIRLLSLVDRTSTTLLERGGMYPRYSSGHLLYLAKGTLFAVPFDASRGEVRGRPSALVDEVSNDTTFGFSRIDVSTDGLMLYRRGRNEGLRTLQWVDRTGTLERLDIEPALFLFPRISPDGTKVVWMVNQGPTADLWIYDSARGTKTRLTDGKGVYSYPVWSPDGQFVVFSAPGGVFWTRADAAGQPQTLTACQGLCFPTSFTSDGGRLAFSELNAGGGAIQTVQVDATGGQLRAGAAELFLQTPSALPFPALSPDGRWIAYADGTSGSYEVYVRAFPDRGNRWLISSGGGSMPQWSRSGRQLFYRTEDSRIMVATYSSEGDTFRADKPSVWSRTKLANTGLTPNFDLSPDGMRAVVLMSAEGPAPADADSHAILVVNAVDELRRTAPEQNR